MKDGSTHPALEKVWNSDVVIDTIASDKVERYVNDYNIINYAAKGLKTCFENNLRIHFKIRQERAIRAWLTDEGLDKKFAKVIQHWINGWSYKSGLPEEELESLKKKTKNLVEGHRRVLSLSSSSSTTTLYTDTCDLPVLLKYYNFLKRTFSHVKKIRKFIVVPQYKIGIHYATFDQVGVQGICKELGIWKKKIKENEKEKDKLKRRGWHLLLDMEKVKRLKPNWDFHYLETDGIGASILFSRKCRSVAGNSSKKLKTNESSKAPVAARYVVGVDPGRANVVSCSVYDTATKRVVRKHRMTAKQYYQESWMTERKRASERKTNKAYKAAVEELAVSDDDGKVDSNTETSFDTYLRTLYRNRDTLWSEKSKTKYRKHKMKVYSRKRRCIANFVNVIVPPSQQDDYHVAFGDAKFATTGKGEHFSSPSRLFGKAIRERVGGNDRFSLEIHFQSLSSLQ